MATLQRSATTFRRSGSSGLVWNERFFSGELAKRPAAELSEPLRHKQAMGPARGVTGGIAPIRTKGPPTIAAAEPPSPKVPACLCCGFSTGKHSTGKRAKRRT
ncbi:uncharacterized protein At1g15400-like [Zingiber officinale]|uniref:Uncharacterized protein n=1 Tax=Zingiber officinale TaxID=94328 RepID=A0A8J5L9D7_ZINOF|nr:uncharacterized protein At1g15400-like [Zingiber officinale]KAG6510704.1 hypothetical protein ZIOFF_028735 [Zingiber officinale]